MHINSTVTAAS